MPDDEPLALPDSAPIEAPQQTPLFHSLEQARYVRQTQIRMIEERTGRRLISYVAGPGTSIGSYDIPPFVDLLHDIDPGILRLLLVSQRDASGGRVELQNDDLDLVTDVEELRGMRNASPGDGVACDCSR